MSTAEGSRQPFSAAVVAAEASGDLLGGGLIEAIRAQAPDAAFGGVAGERMRAVGCAAWHQSEDISVMGIAEVLPHLLRLVRLRRSVADRIVAESPDVFVGIDSPAFNLPIAARVRRAGIPTVQYVSPQVWAWRQNRVREIREACDRVLCLLPFEPEFFARHGVSAAFVGHPLADDIPEESDVTTARQAIGMVTDGPVLALLPGSRGSEVGRLARPFLETAAWLEKRVPGLRVAVAVASHRVEGAIRSACSEVHLETEPLLVRGGARTAVAASDVVLTASGTAALETMLVKRPMVVAYRMASLSFALIKRMGISRLPHYSLPNLLAGREVAREFVQREVRPDLLGPALADCLEGRGPAPDWRALFAEVHASLRGGGSDAAASEILSLTGRKRA